MFVTEENGKKSKRFDESSKSNDDESSENESTWCCKSKDTHHYIDILGQSIADKKEYKRIANQLIRSDLLVENRCALHPNPKCLKGSFTS
jgi:hypothetical protein